MTPKTLLPRLGLLLLCYGFFCNQTAAQQRFQQSLSWAFMSTYQQQQTFVYEPYQRPAYEVLTPKNYRSFVTLLYHPRINVKNWAQQGLSVSLPIAISAFAEVSSAPSTLQPKRNYLLLNLPITAEWAWGYRAQRTLTQQTVGFYLAAGGALTLGRGTVGEFTNVNPYVTGGLRLRLTERLGLELAYGQNFLSVLSFDEMPPAEEFLPPNFDQLGVRHFDVPERRGTHLFHLGVSFH